MNMKEIMMSDKEMLSPADVAEVIGCKPYSINRQAKQNISALGFPASLIGTRVYIPRLGFIAWMEGIVR